MDQGWPVLIGEVLDAMARGEAAQARDRALALVAAPRPYPTPDPAPLSSLWDPFVNLLQRRGYFVHSERQLHAALQEILEMGPGFDLYDLAAALARCDALHASRLESTEARVFPELRSFSAAPES